MPKINYYDGEKYVEYEVSDEVAKGYAEISQEEQREYWRVEKRPDESSLDEMAELGEDAADEFDITEFYIEQERMEALSIAMKRLLPAERELLRKRYFEKKTLAAIAREKGLGISTIQDRFEVILSKIRKFMS